MGLAVIVPPGLCVIDTVKLRSSGSPLGCEQDMKMNAPAKNDRAKMKAAYRDLRGESSPMKRRDGNIKIPLRF